MFVLVLWNFDDPRLSPVYLFDSLETAKESCVQTFPDRVLKFTTYKSGIETGVTCDEGLIGTIWEKQSHIGKLPNLPPHWMTYDEDDIDNEE